MNKAVVSRRNGKHYIVATREAKEPVITVLEKNGRAYLPIWSATAKKGSKMLDIENTSGTLIDYALLGNELNNLK